MADGHHRYERLAVGHVVGGLDDVDAARFRAHLTGCAPCRSRVTELREIATSLTAAEQDEREQRSAARGATDVQTRADRAAPPRLVAPASWHRWPWRVVAIGLLPVLVLGVLAWVVWVRAENHLLAALATTQGEALELMATGIQLDLTTEPGVTGAAATDAGRVSVVLTGLPELDADQGLVLWLLDAEGVPVHVSDPLLRTVVSGGRILLVVDRVDGDAELVVTIETLPSELDAPRGARMAATPLPGAVRPG